MSRLLATLIPLLAASQAWGAPSTLKVSVAPQTYAKASLEDFREPGDRGQVEVSASTWTPTAFNVAAHATQVTPFERSSLPSLSLRYLTSPYFQGTLGSLSFGFGLRFLQLRRSGSVEQFSILKGDSQNAYLGSLEGEVIARPRILKIGHWQGEIGVGLLPTVAVITQSLLAAEQTATGAMALAQAALTYSFPSWKGGQLRFGVEQTLGLVSYEYQVVGEPKPRSVEWALSGFGANVALRFPL